MEIEKVIDGDLHKKVVRFIKVTVPVLVAANQNKRKDGEAYKGVHVVYSKFNALFRERFPALEVRAVTKQLEHEQLIATVPVKGGAMLYLWHDKPESYMGPATDQTDLNAAINAQLALLEASEAMEEAKEGSTFDDETLDRLTDPSNGLAMFEPEIVDKHS